MLLVTAKQMQEMDKQSIKSFGISGIVLMENAGKGAYDFLVKQFKNIRLQKVAILAGCGNNGGDGFVIARYLIQNGVDVTCFLLSYKKKVKKDAKINLDLAQKLCDKSKASKIVEIPDINAFNKYKADLVHHHLFIDAILGTGLNSDVRGFFKDVIELINSLNQPVFSIDIPSGLNSDTGRPLGVAIKANATATFAFAKSGHILYPGNIYTGDLKIIDIGIPDYIVKKQNIKIALIEKDEVAGFFTKRKFSSHKGSYGHLLVIAGSVGKTGAAILCANAAMRCGTGLVTLGIAKSLNRIIEPVIIEPMTYPLPEKEKGYLSDNSFDDIQLLLKNRQALALGPGIGTKKGTIKLVHKLVETSKVPLILDADALNCIAQNPEILKSKKAAAILTPHPGEMARLCNTTTDNIQNNRLEISLKFAQEYNVILVLKGAMTIISFPDGQSSICPVGNPGMATGGMGDVLTGIIAGLCAQGLTPENASIAGVYIHGMSADILYRDFGEFGFIASDMIKIIPKAIHK